MPAQPLKKLNEQHRRFVHHYLEDYNAARAARLAGYSAKSADRQAHDLLKDPLVRELIKERQAEIEAELNLSLAMIMREYKRVAFANLERVATWDKDGKLLVKTPEELTPGDLAALCEISNVTIEKEGMTKVTQKVKMYNKVPALDRLARLYTALSPDGDEDAGGIASLLEMEEPDARP